MTETDGKVVDVVMPQLGVSVTEGTLLEWKRQVGERIELDETLCEISTDKVDNELPSAVAGIVAELLIEPGESVDVGVVIARIAAADGAVVAAVASEPAAEPALDSAPKLPTAAPATDAAEPARGRRGAESGQPRTSPLVRRMAADHDLDLSEIEGTGSGGRITKRDVERHLESAPAKAAQPAVAASPAESSGEPQQLSRMRLAIAKHMRESLDTAAHSHTWIDVDMSRVEARRQELGVTALAVVSEAAIQALALHPLLNAWIDGEAVTVHREVHLGIAVSLGGDGLVVPVIHDAQQLSALGLAERIRDVAKRARAGELAPDDLAGATFTITNPGVFGSLMNAPIINQPQVAILDLEAIVKRPVVISGEEGDSIAIRPVSIFGLGWDHRALDGALAAEYLGTLRRILERGRAS